MSYYWTKSRFNIKDVADMSSVYEHFDKYHDIGVILNADVSGIPEINPSLGINQLDNLSNFDMDHLTVIDSGLSHDAVVAQTHHATDAILGNIHLHIPGITIIFSSIREFKLLLKNDTDIFTSIKHIGLDALGTGTGGFVGAKTGAVIGTAITPGVGTVVGVILGAIAGCLTGRLVTNRIKGRSFKKALTEYQETLPKTLSVWKSFESKYTKVWTISLS